MKTIQDVRIAAWLIIMFGIIFYICGRIFPTEFFLEFRANVLTEMVSIGITILVVDQVYKKQRTVGRKAQLIRMLQSGDYDVAQRAILEMKSQVSESPYVGDLTRSWITDGELRNCPLTGCLFEDAELYEADFEGANLMNSVFYGSILSRANFKGCNLKGVDFTDAVLDDALFVDAVYDERTKWPEVFSVENSGAILYQSNRRSRRRSKRKSRQS